jgi:pimeloyl-ACP methyl ester carboxylesterase
MLTQKDDRIINSLPNISAPTLIVVGEDDKPFLSAAEYMNNKILNSKKIIIPKAGHAVNIDQPKLFNSAVLDFLKR